MPRTNVPITVLDAAGNGVAGASVNVKLRSTGANATIYTTETGPTTASNPLTTDAAGRVTGWVVPGSYNAVCSGPGFSTYTQPFDATVSVGDVVTSLPSGAVVGQTVIYNTGVSGIYWHLMYNGTNWTFLGGPSLRATGSSPTVNATNTYAPSDVRVTPPLSGLYTYSISAVLAAATSENVQAGIGLASGTTAINPHIYVANFGNDPRGNVPQLSTFFTPLTSANLVGANSYAAMFSRGTAGGISYTPGQIDMQVTPVTVG